MTDNLQSDFLVRQWVKTPKSVVELVAKFT